MVKLDGQILYIVGDLFDIWFDYKTVVPRGYIRLLGKLAELKDAGVEINFFVGNHDLWMEDYFTAELDIPIHRKPIHVVHHGKKFMIGHGDGLGPRDTGYKLMKKIFTNPFCKWLYRWLHPDIGIPLASFFSSSSRKGQKRNDYFLGDEDEWLLMYSRRKSAQLPDIDYFVFGHRHLALDIALPNGQSRYINLGEWFDKRTYAIFDGNDMVLKKFSNGI